MINKKNLLKAAMIAGLMSSAATSAYADMGGESFYVQLMGGMGMMNANSVKSEKIDDKLTGDSLINYRAVRGNHATVDAVADIPESVKSKRPKDMFVDLAFGYRFDENMRADISLGYAKPKYKFSKKGDISQKTNVADSSNTRKVGDWSLNHKGDATVLYAMANAYYDFEVNDDFTVFAGIGAGFARNKVKFKVVGSSEVKATDAADGFDQQDATTAKKVDASIKGKNKNRFAYALHLGTAYKLNEQVQVVASYSWKDFGKSKNLGMKVKGHFVGLGLRYSM